VLTEHDPLEIVSSLECKLNPIVLGRPVQS
jgi:hypothetical protein